MRSFAKALATAVMLASAMPAVLAQSSQPQRLYQDALDRERALRKEMDAAEASPSLLARIRALVGAYDDMSKLFPSSGYGDNGLWQGARLSADAFWQFGEASDRTAALRLFAALTSRFPTSSLVRQVSEHTKRLNEAKPESSPRTASAPTRGLTPVPTPVPTPTVPPASQRDARPRTSGVTALNAIRRDVLPEALRITLELAREVPFYSERIDGPARVFIDLQNTRPVEPLTDAAIPFPDDMVKQIRVGRQADAKTRVVLDLRGAGHYSIYTLYEPYRIVVDFERPTTGADAVVARSSDGGATAVPAAAASSRAPSPPLPAAPVTLRPAEAKTTRPSDVQPASKVDLTARDAAQMAAVSKVVPTGDGAVAPIAARRPAPGSSASTIAIDGPTTGTGDEPPIVSLDAAIVRGTDAASTRPAPLPPSANRNGNFSLSRQLGLGIARVVIDAGHGGHDPGAQARGLTEADLVLDIAVRLEKLMIKEGGFEVVLTRRTNTYVSLEERTAIANKAGADLFLSIHSNASASASARGIETYFLNFAPNPEAEAVAARENAGESRTMRSLPDIVRAIAMNNKRTESRDFASMVQNSMYTEMRKSNKELRNLGVKQAPFMVLVGATMPAVLAEISFITNRQDASLLKTDKYRQQIAEALLAGVKRYQQSLKRLPDIATK